jgi:hypothetical protein
VVAGHQKINFAHEIAEDRVRVRHHTGNHILLKVISIVSNLVFLGLLPNC